MQLNIFGQILAALSGVAQFLPGFRHLARFRASTPERRKRTDVGGKSRNGAWRWSGAKAARSYQVRYTNRFSRARTRDALLHDATIEQRSGNTAESARLYNAAATFPW